MNLLDNYKVTIHTALLDTQRSHNDTDGWLGVVHVHYAQAGRDHRRNVYVIHDDEDTVDDYGATGTVKVFPASRDALNAALRLSKRVQVGTVHVSRGRREAT